MKRTIGNIVTVFILYIILVAAFKGCVSPSPLPQPPPIPIPEPQPTPYYPPKPEPTPAEKYLLVINTIREEKGLELYKFHERVQEAAQVHADNMANERRMYHGAYSKRLADTGFEATKNSENVAWNYESIDSVVDGWMRSPGHRANILGEYEYCGIAVAEKDNGPYWCMVTASGE